MEETASGTVTSHAICQHSSLQFVHYCSAFITKGNKLLRRTGKSGLWDRCSSKIPHKLWSRPSPQLRNCNSLWQQYTSTSCPLFCSLQLLTASWVCISPPPPVYLPTGWEVGRGKSKESCVTGLIRSARTGRSRQDFPEREAGTGSSLDICLGNRLVDKPSIWDRRTGTNLLQSNQHSQGLEGQGWWASLGTVCKGVPQGRQFKQPCQYSTQEGWASGRTPQKHLQSRLPALGAGQSTARFTKSH